MNSLFAKRLFQIGRKYRRKCIEIRRCSNFALNIVRPPPVTKSEDESHLFDNEQYANEFFYKLLISQKKYRHLIAFTDYANDISSSVDADSILHCDWTEKPFYALVDDLKTLTHSFKNTPKKFDDPRFLDFCRNLLNQLPDALDDHLLNILKILTLWPTLCRIKDGLFFQLCKAIDDELVKRGKMWGRDRLLLSMDHFYRLRLVRYSSFIWENMKRLGRAPWNLTPEQFVHSMFLMNVHRRTHPVLNLLTIEQAIKHHIYELSMEELAILLLAFFKTKRSIKDAELVDLLYAKLDINLERLDDLTLTAFLKILRKSTHYPMRHRTVALLDKLKDRVDHVSMLCCTHIALLGTVHVLILHPETLNKIYRRFVKEISSARLKDIERLLFVSALYDYDVDTDIDFYNLTIQELRKRTKEIQKYPKIFLYAVSYLCQKRKYDFTLVNEVLSESFLNSLSKNLCKYNMPPALLQIAIGIRLECPNYTGNNLDMKLINEFAEGGICYRIPSSTDQYKAKSDAVMLQVKNTVAERFGGENFLRYIYLIPYSARAEIIFCMKDGKAVEIPNEMKTKQYCLDVSPPPNIGQWYAILLLTSNNTIADTRKPTGSALLKKRHLSILGYRCLLIHETDWGNLNLDKRELLNSMIENYESNS